jgi:hypothetical protein
MSEFLDTFEATITGHGIARFVSCCQGERDLEYRLIADPGYDQIFKLLFQWGTGVDRAGAEERAMSFLNSVLFPDAGEMGERIFKMAGLPNEITHPVNTSGLGVLTVDAAFMCWIGKGGEKDPFVRKVVDMEMQTKPGPPFLERLIDYSASLRLCNTGCEVFVLGLVNSRTGSGDDSYGLRVFMTNVENEEAMRCLSGPMDINCLDLSTIAGMIKENRQIRFHRKELGVVAKEWLKLLSVRQWATLAEGRYVIAKAPASDPGVNSAITMLEHVSRADLDRLVLNETWADRVLSDEREKGYLMGVTEEKKARVVRLLRLNYPPDQVATIMEMTETELEALLRSLE